MDRSLSPAASPDADRDGSDRVRRSPSGRVVAIAAVVLIAVGFGLVAWVWQPWRPADPNVPGSSHPVALVHLAGEQPRSEEAIRAAASAELNCPESWSVTISGHRWTGRTDIPEAWWGRASIDGTLEVGTRTGYGDVTSARFSADGQVIEMTGGTTGFVNVGCPAIA